MAPWAEVRVYGRGFNFNIVKINKHFENLLLCFSVFGQWSKFIHVVMRKGGYRWVRGQGF